MLLKKYKKVQELENSGGPTCLSVVMNPTFDVCYMQKYFQPSL